ncbi:MAG: hypothetical protein NZV14_10185 [Bryobacteraceae bacterium]|nr:hypothetical protein [Bryobacteraceae bacterium]MDW8378521.1 hypothetical protein [Bryobacterales bacterium]
MKRFRWFALTALLAAVAATAQQPGPRREDDFPRLPDGRSQLEEILKADHNASLKDAAELVRLSEELKLELEKSGRHVLSLGMIKKTEEIEKLAKRIRSRLKRY